MHRFLDRLTPTLSSNADSCADCHSRPQPGGSESPVSVTRVGRYSEGKFVAGPEGGIHHLRGTGTRSPQDNVEGLRISTNLLGAGYVAEAIP